MMLHLIASILVALFAMVMVGLAIGRAIKIADEREAPELDQYAVWDEIIASHTVERVLEHLPEELQDDFNGQNDPCRYHPSGMHQHRVTLASPLESDSIRYYCLCGVTARNKFVAARFNAEAAREEERRKEMMKVIAASYTMPRRRP